MMEATVNPSAPMTSDVVCRAFLSNSDSAAKISTLVKDSSTTIPIPEVPSSKNRKIKNNL